tara:strand:+ start:2269 stop:2535 length:267 start_codon:yes stop_codon:yes gene_type:complete
MYETIQIVFFSLCIIMFFHYFYNYLIKTYTTPITKDIVGIQTQKYKNIINTLNSETDRKTIEPSIEEIPIVNEESMEDELLQHALSEI